MLHWQCIKELVAKLRHGIKETGYVTMATH